MEQKYILETVLPLVYPETPTFQKDIENMCENFLFHFSQSRKVSLQCHKVLALVYQDHKKLSFQSFGPFFLQSHESYLCPARFILIVNMTENEVLAHLRETSHATEEARIKEELQDSYVEAFTVIYESTQKSYTHLQTIKKRGESSHNTGLSLVG
jgi:hypothetical protein